MRFRAYMESTAETLVDGFNVGVRKNGIKND